MPTRHITSSLPALPHSATHGSTGLLGLLTFIFSAWILQGTYLGPSDKTLFILAAGAFTMIMWELLVLGTHKRTSTGIEWTKRDLNLKRSAIKILGFTVTAGILACLYIIFPEYEKPQYKLAWDALFTLLPFFIPAAIAYIVIVDGVMKNPEDGYYSIGLIALGQYTKANRNLIAPHIRSWLIKGFFAPLMFVFIAKNIGNLPANMDKWAQYMHTPDIVGLSLAAMFLLLSIDLAFTACGYLFALRVIDTHERSTEPTFLGWIAALICYEPIWGHLEKSYFHKGPTPDWKAIAEEHAIFSSIWATLFVLLLAIYSWATMAFGLRFSNLTHRGIITSGPYRFTKHPAYIAKNLSWWMTAAPFLLIGENPATAIQTCIVLLMINGIYYVRAKTEERHLSQDQTYRDYAAWIERHGIFRWINFKRS